MNFSLSEEIFPSSFKQAIFHPLLKKLSPLMMMMISTTIVLFIIWTSSPKFLRKLLPLDSRIQSHLLSNSLSSSFQSETPLLRIPSSQRSIMVRSLLLFFLMYLLPSILLIIASFFIVFNIGLVFMALLLIAWFSSNLISRSQAVSIQNPTSSFSNLSCGVPQGSVLGPLLFTLYRTPLGCHLQKLNQIPPLC